MSMLKRIKEKKHFPPPLKKKIPSRKFHTSSNLERKIWKFPNPVRRALLGKTAIKNIEHGNWVPTGIFDKIEVLKIPHFKPQNELNKKNQEKKKKPFKTIRGKGMRKNWGWKEEKWYSTWQWCWLWSWSNNRSREHISRGLHILQKTCALHKNKMKQ